MNETRSGECSSQKALWLPRKILDACTKRLAHATCTLWLPRKTLDACTKRLAH